MTKVYVVSSRRYAKPYYAEPSTVELITKVFDDYHKVVDYICKAIKEDHKYLDKTKDDLTHWRKHEPNPDNFIEGYYIKSIEYSDVSYYESTCYKFRSYDVE